MKKIFFVLLPILLLSYTSSASEKRPITSEDFYLIKQITDCQVSPNGKTIAYVLESVDRENNCYISNLWLIATSGGESRQLTTSRSRDTSPQWSPDSKYIVFTSDRSGNNQIWIISVEGGEAWTLTDMPDGAYSPSWSPDAQRIAFLSRISEDINTNRNKPSRVIRKDGKEYATDVKVIRELKYRYDTKYFDEKYAHIFVIPVNGGKAKQLTFGNYHDSAPVWSPDSKSIAFSSNRNGDFRFDNNYDLYLVPSTGGEIEQLTHGAGPEHSPIWSPDGKYICYLSATKPNDYAEQKELWTINIKTKQAINLTAHFDRIPFEPQWFSDGKKIFFLAADQGNVHLYSTSSNKEEINKVISGYRQLQSFHVLTNKIVFRATANTNPGDIFLASISGKPEKQLTHINLEFFNTLDLIEPTEVFFTSFDNTQIHGWIMKPMLFSEDKKYPLILQIHGGPHWYYGNCWSQEFQILAAQGYVIFYCNPRLSTSYGQEFARLSVGQWGKGDFEDIMAGVDYVIRSGFIDTTRMGVTGGSYGGFMTNWIISHSNRFKTAVTQRSISNLLSFYGTTDIQNFVEFEFGLPWENWDKLIRHSPIFYAQNINTPLLIIHSELDYRVPISQAEELFTLLKRRNVPVEFIRYPDEGHELSRSGQPVHRVDRYNRIVDWFNKYLR